MRISEGLSHAEAGDLLRRLGPNEIRERNTHSLARLIGSQVKEVMALVLLGAAGVSFALGDPQDAAVILAIVILNVSLGVLQQYRAEKAIAALKRTASPPVRVRRSGTLLTLPARDLVPGDLIYLEVGQIVPADCRLLECAQLQIQESVLTGESLPVDKEIARTSLPTTPLAERADMAFQGTLVVRGRALAQVEATGMRTELGHIASSLQKVQTEPTPLQRRLDQLARYMVVVVLLLCAAVFALGIRRGEDPHLMFLTSVSMAVAAIPESFPAVVSIALALGAQRMLHRRALVRKLSAVETLGSVTVICTDKTGTLTENRMSVAVLDIAGHRVDVNEVIRRGHPVMQETTGPHPEIHGHPALALLLAGGALCSDAILSPTGEKPREYQANGDPTETALVLAAAHFGLWKEDLDRHFPRVFELAFDSERKRMSTFHQTRPALGQEAPLPLPRVLSDKSGTDGPRHYQFSKGSMESVLAISRTLWVNESVVPMDREWKARIHAATDDLARNGMRVLAVGYREVPPPGTPGSLEEDQLTFVGLIGLHDPPRPEAREALRLCREAGIAVHMVTGDHPTTAQSIARELGMEYHTVLTGQDIQSMSVEALAERIEGVPIFARVSPEHKLKIIEALKARGHVVAMTGDGVNDGPALKRADIGVAMGGGGTDVAREASDMVLLDDHFATLVSAIQEGRTIYDNIKKLARYLLTTNAAELAVMLIGPLLGMPLPLWPLQILWINLITDGPPALALGVEPAEPGVMRRKPRPVGEPLVDRRMGWHVVGIGIWMAAAALGAGAWLWSRGDASWQTVVFSTLVFSQLANVLAVRSGNESIFRRGLPKNWVMTLSLLGVALAHLGTLYIPSIRTLLTTRPLSPSALVISMVISGSVLLVIEGEKWIQRRQDLRSA